MTNSVDKGKAHIESKKRRKKTHIQAHYLCNKYRQQSRQIPCVNWKLSIRLLCRSFGVHVSMHMCLPATHYSMWRQWSWMLDELWTLYRSACSCGVLRELCMFRLKYFIDLISIKCKCLVVFFLFGLIQSYTHPIQHWSQWTNTNRNHNHNHSSFILQMNALNWKNWKRNK